MDASSMSSAGPIVPWWALVAAALLSLTLGAAFSSSLSAKHAPALPATRGGAPSHKTLSSVPVGAQSAISAALGAASPAYRVSPSGDGFHAVSPTQRLGARFERSGVTLFAGALQLGLSLRAAGYGTSLQALGDVTPTVQANRVSYAHAHLSEWYVNGPLGLEQGFTVPRAPAGHPAGPLTLSMALSGNAKASLSARGQSITLSRAGARPLRYGGLAATDARGRTLHSWLALHGERLLIRVDTRGARYPLRIDPLVQQGTKLTTGNGSGEGLLGYSVALSADGNTALVGAPGTGGAAGAAGGAWVFTRSGSTWTQGERLVPSEQEDNGPNESCVEEVEGTEETGQCRFGRSVALSADGSTALIGSPRDHGNVGAAWVFTRSGSTWTQLGQKLTGGGEGFEGRFGRSVALSGDGSTALIGGSSGRGSAWVFTRSEAGFEQQGPKLTNGKEEGEAHFGGSVALSADGNTALIGAPGQNASPSGSSYTGAAWVFTRSGSTWPQQGEELLGSEESGAGHFGNSVALSGNGATALIGGRLDNAGAGAAWVFTLSGSSWSQQGTKLSAPAAGSVGFGSGVALSSDGNTALIGAFRADVGAGAAWVLARSGSTWTPSPQGAKLTGYPEEVGKGMFGASVALSADATSAVVGGPGDNSKAGAVWAFVEGPAASKVPPPVVKKVLPNRGPAAGGTTVTITGTGFDEGETKVMFGSAPATGVTVLSQTKVTAVSPAGAPGEVDVTVTTPGATSEATAKDRFTYEAAPTGNGGPQGGNSTSSSSTGSSAASGALALEPVTASGSRCRVSLPSARVAVQSRSWAAIKLLWSGPGKCAGRLTLRVKVKRGHQRTTMRTIGAGTFSIPPGKLRVVTIRLNATGRSLLKAGHGRLNASLLILKLSPGPAQARTASVRLQVQKAGRGTTPKK